jgi:hypothetical protein
MSIRSKWLIRTLIRLFGAAAIPAWALLASGVALGDVRISSQAVDPETAALVETVRQSLNFSPGVTALDARVTIGAAAFREALAEDDTRPLVAAYLSSIEFETALNGRERPRYVTAVFSNPDPIDQVILARKLLGRSTIGVFDSQAAHSLVPRVASKGVRTIQASPGQGVDSLLRAANSIDVMVVMPDDAVLNRSNISHVVRALYQQRKFLVGYSDTLTRVGCLASVYVPPEAIARSVAKALEHQATSGVLPEPAFVRDVAVSLNERLARSLNISLPDRAEILDAIRAGAAERAQ